MNPYLRAAMNSYTWRRVLFTQALALLIGFLMAMDWGYYGEYIHHTSIHFVTMGVYVLLLLPVAYCTDEALARGARPSLTYVFLLVVVNPVLAVAVAGGMQFIYLLIYALPWPPQRWGFTGASIHFSVPCSLGLLVFLNGRAAERMLEGIRGAELRRVQLDQQLVESRLATAEAQMDPQMLFRTLAHIKQGLQNSRPDAEKDLDELIQKLRTALARTRAVPAEEHES
jgi:nitrate reductase NapE component